MPGYTKLFSTIVTSTVWQEDSDTRVVWVTLLALADPYGKVDATVPGLANIAKVPIDKCRKALKIFSSPDPDSRSQEHAGRRIKKIDGGWQLLNYAKYRNRMRDRTDYYRQYRATKRNQAQPSITKGNHSQPIADAEADAEAEHSPFSSLSLDTDTSSSLSASSSGHFWDENSGTNDGV